MLIRLLFNDQVVWQGKSLPIGRDFEQIFGLKEPPKSTHILLEVSAKRILNRSIVSPHSNTLGWLHKPIETLIISHQRKLVTFIIRDPIDLILHNSNIQAHIRNHQEPANSYNITPVGCAEFSVKTDTTCRLNIHGSNFRWFYMNILGHTRIKFREFQVGTGLHVAVLFIKLWPGVYVCYNGKKWSECHVRGRPFIMTPDFARRIDRTFPDFYMTYRMRYYRINSNRYSIYNMYYRRVIIVGRMG